MKIFIGIDWADKKHDIHVSAGQEEYHEVVQQDFQKLNAWYQLLLQKYPQGEFVVCLEQSRGALVNILKQFEQLKLYPINPKQLSKYRAAIYPSGSKTDPKDAQLMAEFIKNHQDRLHLLTENGLESLNLANEKRRKLVDSQTKLIQRLTAVLKETFPDLLKVISVGSISRREFIMRFPTVEALQRSKKSYVAGRLNKAVRGSQEQQANALKCLFDAANLLTPAMAEIYAIEIKSIVQQIDGLAKSISQLNKIIATTAKKNPQYEIFQTLPGAGAALAPRLLAGVLGNGNQAAEQLQCYAGVAPVTEQSGDPKRGRNPRFRYARPKFLHQSFVEFADQSVRFSAWARAFFTYRKSKNDGVNTILRKLAFKWIRIICKCVETNQSYDEDRYIECLKKNNVEYLGFLKTT